MVRVNVRCYLEYESCKFLVLGTYHALYRLNRAWARCYLDKAVKQLLNTKIVQRRAEENRSHLGIEIILNIEFGIYTLYQLQIGAELESQVLTYVTVKFFTLNVYRHLFGNTLLIRCEKVELSFVYVIDTLETRTLVYRPTQRTHCYLQFALKLVQQLERVTALTVHLVHIDDYRGIAHAADRHELACLSLHTLRAIDNDDYAVNSSKCTERILGEILVTRCIENVDLVTLIIEFHHRGCH